MSCTHSASFVAPTYTIPLCKKWHLPATDLLSFVPPAILFLSIAFSALGVCISAKSAFVLALALAKPFINTSPPPPKHSIEVMTSRPVATQIPDGLGALHRALDVNSHIHLIVYIPPPQTQFSFLVSLSLQPFLYYSILCSEAHASCLSQRFLYPTIFFVSDLSWRRKIKRKGTSLSP